MLLAFAVSFIYKIYGGSNLDVESVRGLINLFSKDIFQQERNEDLIGRVYEYFIGEFADSEGKRGGEYFTPPYAALCIAIVAVDLVIASALARLSPAPRRVAPGRSASSQARS